MTVRVTLRHMLTHTSGMGEATADESKTATKLAELIPAYAKKPVAFEPGTQWKYCQSGINSLARVVEVVSGESFPDFLQKRLFDPLLMADTAFYLTKSQMSRLATPAALQDGRLVEAQLAFLQGKSPVSRDRYPGGHGGLFSTAPDYARFAQMILNGGTLAGKRYLTAESIRLMTMVQTGELQTGFTPGNGWGLGWCVIRNPQGVTETLSSGSYGHGGAYGTQAWIDPRKGLALILMVQRSNFPNSDASEVRRAFQESALRLFSR
jgi:CubicO group peptidase (beta-lactamase class C family)